MLLNNRVILSKNGVLKDLSMATGNYISGSSTLDIVAATDILYIGSDLPFNHRYFKFETANNLATVASVEYYSNNTWVPVVDILDDTDMAGASFGKNGILSFTPDKQYSWQQKDTKNGSTSNVITELSSVTIYNLYWARIKFTNNFFATTAIKYIGHKFANDEDLAAVYPDLIRTEVYEQFEAGKTNWDEQLIYASENIIRDLKARNILKSPNQILDSSLFTAACVHHLAEIIFHSFGTPYKDSKKAAHEEYLRALNLSVYKVDENADALLGPEENVQNVGYLSR